MYICICMYVCMILLSFLGGFELPFCEAARYNGKHFRSNSQLNLSDRKVLIALKAYILTSLLYLDGRP